MSEEISIYRYELVSRGPLNARSERVSCPGVLIRVGSDSFGYGCLHPWPELGDGDLGQELGLLREGGSSVLIQRALECAKVDGEARRAGVSLFDGVEVPVSHATIPLSADALAEASAAGFAVVKLKVGRDLETERELLGDFAKVFPDLRWRMDFNHACCLAEVDGFLTNLSDELRARIDFLEDAWLPGEKPGRELQGVKLAVDRGDGDFPVVVVKPAVDDVEDKVAAAAQAGAEVVVTSYMDHPLGQSYAALQAGVMAGRYAGVVGTCGLMTHGLFERDAFSERLGEPAPVFISPGGTGLGFDDLLENLPWKPLM